jgi:hypothetical protein
MTHGEFGEGDGGLQTIWKYKKDGCGGCEKIEEPEGWKGSLQLGE